MKKLFVGFLLLFALFSMVGCNKPGDDDDVVFHAAADNDSLVNQISEQIKGVFDN